MNERLKHLGRLEESKLRAEELRLRMRGLIESLREHIDPFERYEELDTELIASQAMELGAAKIAYAGVLDEIKAIEKALGLPVPTRQTGR
jgi:hypothetical protein